MKNQKYIDHYQKSIENSDSFWLEEAQKLDWYQKPTIGYTSQENQKNEWFVDGVLNMSYLCIDKHILDGFGDQIAIIYDSPVTNVRQEFTFIDLKEEVAKLAGGLHSLGLRKGDCVIIYMPMIPQAVFAMLACARIGLIHSVVFGGFAAHELAIRIDDCKPKVILTASNGVEINKIIHYKPMVDEAISLCTYKPNFSIIFDRKMNVTWDQKPYDLDYEELKNRSAPILPIHAKSTDPLYILYTSGTTGTPKGIVRDTGGYATALFYSMSHIYGIKPGEVFWAASDVGWVVGHSYIVYGPLLHRNTTVIFEGKPVKTPDASTFWRVISENNVKVMFTAPTAIRAIKMEDLEGVFLKKYDLTCLKYQFLAGERCDTSTLNWLEEKLNIPVIDHWWQTESGWPMLGNLMGLDPHKTKPGAAGKPIPGYKVDILSESGEIMPPNQEGYVAVKLPLPPGMLSTLWNNHPRFIQGYFSTFEGYYLSGDGGFMDENNYVTITGRIDDVINVAGHRLSTAEMEEIVSTHYAVAECAVFGIHCDLKGQKPLALIVIKKEFESQGKEIAPEIIQLVREKIGAVASFRDLAVVQRLPKTRSGKILRKILHEIADKVDIKIPSTIDDPQIIEEIKKVYKANKIGINFA